MNLPELEREVLKLPPEERARLAEALLESLDALSAEETRRLWIEEARQRDSTFDASSARQADEIFRVARERLG